MYNSSISFLPKLFLWCHLGLFSATAIVKGKEVKNFSLKQYIGKKNVILFFYPKDFTFVCPTELHSFQDTLSDFENKNTVFKIIKKCL